MSICFEQIPYQPMPPGQHLYGLASVSKPPTFAHGILISRVSMALAVYCDRLGVAQTATGNAIVHESELYMIPDIIVTSGRRPLDTAIETVTECWLAVEVLSPTTRTNDIRFKRNAYHELDVDTVWLVDYETRSVMVSHRETPRQVTVVKDSLHWQPPGVAEPFVLSLEELFRDD